MDSCAALAPLHRFTAQQVLVTVYPAPRMLPAVLLQSDVQPLEDRLRNPVTLNSVKSIREEQKQNVRIYFSTNKNNSVFQKPVLVAFNNV